MWKALWISGRVEQLPCFRIIVKSLFQNLPVFKSFNFYTILLEHVIGEIHTSKPLVPLYKPKTYNEICLCTNLIRSSARILGCDVRTDFENFRHFHRNRARMERNWEIQEIVNTNSWFSGSSHTSILYCDLGSGVHWLCHDMFI